MPTHGVHNYANGDVRAMCYLCDPRWFGTRMSPTTYSYGDALQELAEHRQRDHSPSPAWFLKDSGWKRPGNNKQLGYHK